MYCEAVHDDLEGFRIWLSPEKPSRILVVRFDHVLCYVNSDEGKRLASVENDAEISFPHVFWKVENSALISEFHRQSLGTSESVAITHFAFLTSSDCIDVLALGDPIFEGQIDE